ncbi:MAG: Crp/Fnr family transcriptional regulator [Candidatus Manganitrophus sp. SA1]|nr:Crp/Fnr family transcriptional regulator [Candidatus Manganitrophus morganii]
MAKKVPPRTENQILEALPAKHYQSILPHLERVSHSLKEVVYRPNEPIEYVYFPLKGGFSLIATMEGGKHIEVATVGNEEMVGIPVFLGAPTTFLMACSQIPGDALRMKSNLFLRAVKENGHLTVVLHKYLEKLMVQIAEGTGCNRTHSIVQRCARWLLTTHDRVHENHYYLTQKFLGQMLGVRRAVVNEVPIELQKQGLFRYSWGMIHILDRKGLEAVACECYRIIKAKFDRPLN